MDALHKRKEQIVSELAVVSKQIETLRERAAKLEFEFRNVLEAIRNAK